MSEKNRKIVIPGEVILEGEDYLPGEGTKKVGKEIIANKYGLSEESNNLVKVISLSGPYTPRRSNIVIGKVINIVMSGWLIDIGSPQSTFLSLNEVPRYVNKNELDQVLGIGDMVVAKIWESNGRGIDLSIKSRGLGKIEEGIVFEINSNKVPRIIGKEGSMINLIKEETNCNITVGQNGLVWIRGENIEEEVLARNSIMFVTKNSASGGLTEELKAWFGKEKGEKK